jgi:hypothetical protein
VARWFKVQPICLPPLSSGGASIAGPSLRFHVLLIEPDMQISRIRLSDKTHTFATFSTRLELRPLSSTGITRLPRYYRPFRRPIGPYLTVTSLRLVTTTDHAIGLPVLCAFSFCICRRYYPDTAAEGTFSLIPSAIAAFPERVVGSACAMSFSKIAQRSLTLRPAHSLDHPFVTSTTAPIASGWSKIAGRDSHPLENAALARRTPN